MGAWSQTNNRRASLVTKVADDYFKSDQYMNAIRHYKAALEENPSNIKAQYQLAECYRLTQDYESAEYYYESIGKEQDIRYPLAGFYYATMQKLKGRYDQSLKNFKDFRKFLVANDLHESEKYRYYYKQAKIEIDGCQLALNQITLVHPDHQFLPLEAPLNSEYNDYAAFTTGSDEILCLTSARSSGKGSLVDNQFGESFADLFRFKKQNGQWVEHDDGDRFEKVINTKYGDGSGSFNRERTKFYYTNCDEDLGEVCHIYMSRLEGGKWTEPKPLNLNINEYGFSSKHPNLTPGGDTLFYVSNREGGIGQLDIYMSINAGNENWGPPINLGPQINTPFNEVSPFYDPGERVLFFASNGHRGFGGFDIYIARGTKFESAEIYNAGIPFNSYRDDIFFFLGTGKGYLSSNREDGPGKFDIYGFTIRSKSDIISEVSTEGTIAGRNSLFTDDYNFDSSETEIINQIISRMLSSSVSDVDLILTERQLEVYNSLSEDDKERIDKIVNARVRKMTSNMIRSIRTEDDYYYQQLSTDKRRKVDNIVSAYLEQQGMGNSVNLNDDGFNFYSGVGTDEREKIDILISDRLKNAQDFKPATPTYNSFDTKEQKSLDGIAIKYLKQKRNLESISLDMSEKVFLRDNQEETANVSTAIRERLIGLSNEEKYRLVKEDRDFYETLTEEEREKLKSIATTFMLSDLSNFDQNVSNADLDVFKNKNTREQNQLDKLLLKQISNLANSSIYLTETTFSQSELQAALSSTSEETVDKLLEMRPELNDLQKSAVERFVKTAYDSYLSEAKPIFFDTTPTVVSTPGTTVAGADPSARLTSSDINQYEMLSESKRRVIDNVIALDYLVSEYSDRTVRLRDEQRLSKISREERVHIAALSKKVSGQEIKSNEQAYVRNAFTYYNNLSQDGKAFFNRVVLDKGLPKRNSRYVLPQSDAQARGSLSSSEQDLLERIKKFRFNNDRILTENLAVEAKDIDEEPVDIIALASSVPVDPTASEKILGAEDILASEELDEIKIELPIDKIDGYDEITISGKLLGATSGTPLSSYAITLIEFDNTKTTIEGYTNDAGEFEFQVAPDKYDLTFKKATSAESVVLENFNVEGRREKVSGIYTNATRAFFDVNSSELRPEVKILLDDVYQAFGKSGSKIEIESHTDDTGAAEYNLGLSKDRGYSARDYLMSKGINKSNISVIWHGSEKPIADNNNPYGRQLNRRIDIRLIGKRKEFFGNFYLVRPGATVAKISNNMGVTADHVREINGLENGELVAYRPIRLKKEGDLDADFNLVVPADIKSGSDFIYTVQPGDNLEIVSKKFNVPEELIMEQNNLGSTTLEVGTRLIIYPKN
ncbi:WD40-like Beta Propeller Repeat [Ekhidna lutea]|uniref:WD40-like Beta Propeller Repeat n=2 Tax=Ekhidna lutea TaxID=447679 RepID=A0A239E8W7_EKHLU|nr:WD40-like Beta Propeller Repeat [Ekhidna lutea]